MKLVNRMSKILRCSNITTHNIICTTIQHQVLKYIRLWISWNWTHLETANISFRCKELTISVSILDNSCKDLIHSVLSICKEFVGVNLDKLLWIGYRNESATTFTWGCSWNLLNHVLRYWRQHSSASWR